MAIAGCAVKLNQPLQNFTSYTPLWEQMECVMLKFCLVLLLLAIYHTSYVKFHFWD